MELAIGICAFVFTAMNICGCKCFEECVYDSMLVYFLPLYILVFSIHRYLDGKKWHKIVYGCSVLLILPVIFIIPKLEHFGNAGIAYLLAAILLVIGNRRLEDGEFAEGTVHVIAKGAVAMVMGGIILGLVMAIIASVEFLFDLHFGNHWTEYTLAFIGFIVTPLICCKMISEPQKDYRESKFLRIVVEYILSPALVIYAAILILYIIRIILKWELPEGGVAYMVIGFICVAMLTRLLYKLVDNGHFDWFHNNLTYIAAAPLVLLWIGIIRRISDYGFTEPRVYLMILAIHLTVSMALMLKKNGAVFQSLALAMAILAVLFTYIPGISAADIGEASQARRPETTQTETAGQDEASKFGQIYKLQKHVSIGDGYSIIPPDSYKLTVDNGLIRAVIEGDMVVEFGNIKDKLDDEAAMEADPDYAMVYENGWFKLVILEMWDFRGSDKDAWNMIRADEYILLEKRP